MIEHNKPTKNNYFFCGIKHCGKTTHAKIFAKNNGLEVIDGDDLILESLDGQSIRSFYKEFGKIRFMQEELKAIYSFIEKESEDMVLSLGGGICDNDSAINLLKSSGIIIFIKVKEDVLYERIIGDGIPPFLEGNSKEKFHALFIEREKKYLDFADIVIKVLDAPIEKTAMIINAEINKWIKNVT